MCHKSCITFSRYRPRSRGDNTFGSVRPSVRPSVTKNIIINHEAGEVIRLVASICTSVLARGVVDIGTWLLPSTAKGPVKHKSATFLKNIRESSSQGAFKMVGRSKLLLFRQVAPSRSITLLIIVVHFHK